MKYAMKTSHIIQMYNLHVRLAEALPLILLCNINSLAMPEYSQGKEHIHSITLTYDFIINRETLLPPLLH